MARKKTKAKKSTWRLVVARFMTIAQCISVSLLLACAASAYVNPADFRWLAPLGLCFPFFLAGTLLFFLLSLLLCWKRAWISVVGLLLCFGSIRNYVPLNFTSPHPKQAFKVVSWNSKSYSCDNLGAMRGEFYAYLREQDADIVCVQECVPYLEQQFRDEECKFYPYIHEEKGEGAYVLLATKYPIVKNERVFVSGANAAWAYWLTPEKEDTILVLNVHLQSICLSKDERENYSKIVHNDVEKADAKESEQQSRSLLSKMMHSAEERALQADSVAHFIQAHQQYPIIVCGDFNDSPVSYARQHIAEALEDSVGGPLAFVKSTFSSRITDCYRTSGNGIGRSFNRDAIYVRIDHILCTSRDFRPFGCHIDTSTNMTSDHYPIVTHLKRKSREK